MVLPRVVMWAKATPPGFVSSWDSAPRFIRSFSAAWVIRKQKPCGRYGLILSHKQYPIWQTVFLPPVPHLGEKLEKGSSLLCQCSKPVSMEMEINIHKQFHSPTQQPRQLLQATFIHGLQGFIQRVGGHWNSPSPPPPQKSWNWVWLLLWCRQYQAFHFTRYWT